MYSFNRSQKSSEENAAKNRADLLNQFLCMEKNKDDVLI